MTEDELIAKLEAATAGSEELDRAIADAALVPVEPARLVGSPVDIPMWRYPNGSTGTELRFTRSIDAALTLAPKNYAWSVQGSRTFPGQAWLYPPNNIADIEYQADAATAPLALCIAALRARAASNTDPTPTPSSEPV